MKELLNSCFLFECHTDENKDYLYIYLSIYILYLRMIDCIKYLIIMSVSPDCISGGNKETTSRQQEDNYGQ